MISKVFHFKYLLFLLLILLNFFFLTNCAHVPKEAIDLSATVSKGIQAQQTAYQNLYDSYLNLKKEKIDEFIKTKYIPTFVGNVRKGLEAEGIKEINDEVMNSILNTIIDKRDSMQTELEKVRIVLWERISQDQMLLLNASNQITSLLKSVTDVQEAANQLLQNTSKTTGIDFMEMDRVFNNYLLKAGDVSEKGTSLLEEIKPIIEGTK
ncbi:MAG: hypothetical protein NTX22_06145 [Ignavibacteriales bacterium]|nr:hypothetical protein [Ignavibacteriales bacterium]